MQAGNAGGSKTVLEVSDVRRVFERHQVVAVDNVSFALHAGEILSILGPSGCGKTTLMRLIAGLDEPDAGDIRIHGVSVRGKAPHRRNVGLVFQTLAVFPHMSVFKNIAFGLRMKGLAAAEIRSRVYDSLDLVRLDPGAFADRMPSQLSGGQLQRVALARTLVTEPAVVLFDEPMAALDKRLRDYMAIELRAIQKRLNVAAIYVTHDQETASVMSDRIAIMSAGRIVQIGTPVDIYEQPENRFVADFLGDINLVSGVVDQVDADGALIRWQNGTLQASAVDRQPGDAVVAMIRPGHVMLSAERTERSFAQGQIATTRFVSGAYVHRIRVGGVEQDFVVHSANAPGTGVGDAAPVWLSVEPEFVRLVGNAA